jgi:hypothetical protein
MKRYEDRGRPVTVAPSATVEVEAMKVVME